ncbi:MAG: hypothetical protein ACD_7C00444G0004, partial [uncultured bacterium]
MLCLDNINTTFFIFSDVVPHLLYYSHLPAMLLSFLFGFFIYFKSNRSLLGKILFFLSISFSLWVLLNLIIWTNSSSSLIIFLWSLTGFLYAFICVIALYFAYVYIDKRDIDFKKKIIFALLLLPTIILIPTNFNLERFDLSNCEAMEGTYFTNYYYGLGFIVFVWIIALTIARYRHVEYENRKQILLLTVGLGFFLVSFFISGYLASYFGNFELEQYGLFGMIFFMGVLGYMIVRFEAFHIKILGTQALVVTLFILIAAQFAFIQNSTNRVLNLIALVLITGFGYILIRSVKREVAQREA